MRGVKLLSCIAYTVVLLTVCYQLPFSLFYTSIHSYTTLFKYVEDTSQARTIKGKEYFSSLDSKSSLEFYNDRMTKNEVSLAIGIITLHRSGKDKSHRSLGYLFQSASVLDGYVKNDRYMKNSFLFICNVDLYPKRHEDAQEISRYLPFVERFGGNSVGLKQDLIMPDSGIDAVNSVFMKETYDYVFCMNAAANLSAKYILLVEDDAIPHRDFPRFLDYLFRNRLHKNSHHSEMAFFKFFFPAKWQGFSFQFVELGDLLSFSILGSTFCVILCYLYRVILSRNHQIDSYTIRKDFFISFIISLITCFVIGRQNINELRRILPCLYRIEPSTMCCTQAMLYSNHIVQPLSQYMLTQARGTHTDLLIIDFASEENLPTYQVEPNLFYHIGLHSSLPMPQKHPQEFVFKN